MRHYLIIEGFELCLIETFNEYNLLPRLNKFRYALLSSFTDHHKYDKKDNERLELLKLLASDEKIIDLIDEHRRHGYCLVFDDENLFQLLILYKNENNNDD